MIIASTCLKPSNAVSSHFIVFFSNRNTSFGEERACVVLLVHLYVCFAAAGFDSSFLLLGIGYWLMFLSFASGYRLLTVFSECCLWV